MQTIKFLHMADLHIGSSAYIKLNMDAMSILHEIIDYSNNKNCNFIFICGDIFDTTPDKNTLDRVKTIFANSTAKIFIIYGNHDYKTAQNINWPSNVIILGINGMQSYYDEETNTRIWGYSYPSNQIEEPIYNNYFKENPINSSEKNILLAHGGDKLHIPIDIDELKDKFNYIALGHFHQYTKKAKNSIYSGSLIPQDRTEMNNHGYIYAQLDENDITHELINISSKYKSYEFDVTNILNIEIVYKTLKETLNKNYNYNIKLIGKKSPSLIIDINHLLNIDNVEDVIDNTILDIDYANLYNENSNNILGLFIKRMYENDNILAKDALEKGVLAFLEEMNDN